MIVKNANHPPVDHVRTVLFKILTYLSQESPDPRAPFGEQLHDLEKGCKVVEQNQSKPNRGMAILASRYGTVCEALRIAWHGERLMRAPTREAADALLACMKHGDDDLEKMLAEIASVIGRCPFPEATA